MNFASNIKKLEGGCWKKVEAASELRTRTKSSFRAAYPSTVLWPGHSALTKEASLLAH